MEHQHHDHNMQHQHSSMEHHSMEMHDMGNNTSHMDHSMHGMQFKKKFFVSLILAIPILLLSPMMGVELPFQFSFPGSNWVVLVLATILYLYGGSPFLLGAKEEIKKKSPAMMTLISLGITVAYFYSVYAFVMNNFFHTDHVMDFFWELASLIVIMLLGHWIEMNAVQSAGSALQGLAKLLPSEATVVMSDGSNQIMPLAHVQIGSSVMVKAGEKIPVDGIILKGNTTVNESMITGESKEIRKQEKDQVIGGSINGSGTITIQVTGTGESGYLAKVMQLVKMAQDEKSSIETSSDKVAKWLFYIASGVALIAFLVWLVVTRDFSIALERMVTVLVIACPHALGLAIPLVVARSTSLAAKNGLLIKNRQVLEVVGKIKYVVMDKTGTLTEGNFSVNQMESINQNYSKQDILFYAAGLESGSNHPLAVGILKEAEENKIVIPQLQNVKTISGMGLVGDFQGKEIKLVGIQYLQKNTISLQQELIENTGASISYLLIQEEVIGFIAQGDQLKPDAKEFVQQLKELGMEPVMLTGDNQLSAQSIAKELRIENYQAELLPEDKEKIIRSYQEKGQAVMMVGDGINDAPSLARADIGVAIGAGTDIAIDSADVILVKSNPMDIIHFLSLAKNTTKKMIQNLWWGAGYNIVAIPLAAGVLAFAGIILTPAVGAILMSLSTIIVAINALTLKMK